LVCRIPLRLSSDRHLHPSACPIRSHCQYGASLGGSKTRKCDILRVFTMSFFCSGTLIPREPRHFRSRSL